MIIFTAFISAAAQAATPADVALAVVYDTSGSMKTPIRAQDGRLAAKHVIAKRAFGLVIDRLERFTQPSAGQPAKRLDLGVVIFDGVRTRMALPLGPFQADAARSWLAALPAPDSGTPLGDAMLAAGRVLQVTPAASKHLLVITDGENTTGSTPLAALKALEKQTNGQDQPIFVHIIALDIPPEVFASLQKAGATLIGAADEKQLQSQLDFILENQILVEAP
ncbi:vWA domain-containing protein [Rariglobus hedericola]|uniref:VWA domain-containing protein n=1 Tax=Rariglobus hedericola TaxID=2597822 RepID=A0A556QJN0_9BACT|nr:VWA domain-containing protein [Rariglobus hedericola]TSJ76839.1 VWA domain-containing protein [Rariglobus hedericola]